MAMCFAILAGSARAGPWSIEPSVGISADYESNPGLHTSDVRAEGHGAGLVDIPMRYDADEVEFMLHPSGRWADSSGYDSLASNYLHLDGDVQFTGDRSTAVWQSRWARDSSLYYIGTDNGLGVRRDTASTAIDWTRALTERERLEIDASWSGVRYDQPPTATSLVDYHYLSAGPTWDWMATERTTVKLIGNAGHYQSLNGVTESKSYNLQVGVSEQLSEVWSSSASAGYARSINSEKIFFGPFLLGSLSSTENATVYSATLNRQGQRLNLIASGSRSLQPTGFAYLARLDAVNATVSYVWSERWDYSASGAWQSASTPVARGQSETSRYISAQMTANWHWTEQWSVTLTFGRISQEYGAPELKPASNGAIFSITHKFLRMESP